MIRRALKNVATLQKRMIIETKDLRLNDKLGRSSFSGINATLFGCTSELGMTVASLLSQTGSRCIFPYRHMEDTINGPIRQLNIRSDLGNKALICIPDFQDQKEMDFAVRNQNVVISCVGSRFRYHREEEFEEANIFVPRTIARAVKNNPGVKRFVYVSAAGADPNSPSIMLRTKWYGEQEVKDIYPDVTILKPTLIFCHGYDYKSFVGKWIAMVRYFNGEVILVGDGMARVQPVFADDVALAIYNCLKMKETIGQTYDLGGPVVYTFREIYELLFNTCNLHPYMTQVSIEKAFDFYNSPAFTSFVKVYLWEHITQESLVQESVNRICNPKTKGFAELFIKPVSFAQLASELTREIYTQANAGITLQSMHNTVQSSKQ